MAAELVLEDGTITPVTPKGNEGFTSEELNELVKGYFQFIRLGENFLVVNEEGKCRSDMGTNQIATDRVARYQPWFVGNGRTTADILKEFSSWDVITGPALFVSGKEAIYLDDRQPKEDYVEIEPTWTPKSQEVQHGWTQAELDAGGYTFIIGPEDSLADEIIEFMENDDA